jgi:MFS family permease
VLGVPSALLLDAVSFYAIAWILLMTKPLPHADPEPGGLADAVKAGLRYIRRRRTLRRLLGAEAAALVFFSAVVPIEVIYAKETLDAGNTGYGLLLGSWGAGMVFGSVVFATLRRAPLQVLLFFSTLAIGAGYLGMAAAQTLAIACAAATVGGAGNGIQWVATISAVQELTTTSMQARVIGTLESMASATPGLGYVIGGVIAAAISPRAAFVAAGVGVILIVVLAVPLLGHRWEEEGGDGQEAGAAAENVDAEDPIMVELLPLGSGKPNRALSIPANSEVER